MEDQNFKFSFFGGFNKKSVVEYVTKIVNNFNVEIDKLKQDYEKQLEQKNEEIMDLSANLKKSNEAVDKLKTELKEVRSGDKLGCDAKKLEEKESLIIEMRKEIEDLKKAASQSQDDNILLEERIRKAQNEAKERVNEVVEQARIKIATEYRKKMEASEKEGKALRGEAIKQASRILSNSAEVAKRVVNESKERINQFIEMAKNEAKDLVDYANLVGQKIVKKSAEAVFVERKKKLVKKLNLDFEVKQAVDAAESGFKIDDELFDAVKKLNADFFLDKTGEVKFSLDNDNDDKAVVDSSKVEK